ncbi:MAG: hypothetical protein KAQ98_13750 [Bacteriovoracaceae bacterium]|nr:hypothetical protein [Bacteriovoracaceae bacterium]
MKKLIAIIITIVTINSTVANDCMTGNCGGDKAMELASMSRSIASKIERSAFEIDACGIASENGTAGELIRHFKHSGKAFDKEYASVSCPIDGDESTLMVVMINSSAWNSFDRMHEILAKYSKIAGKNYHAHFYNTQDIKGRTLIDYIDEMIESAINSGNYSQEGMKLFESYRAKIEAVGGKKASEFKA